MAALESNPDAFSLVPGAEPLVGYRLIERLGKGGFGEVWKADAPGGFQVALKFVRLEDGAGVIEERSLAVINRIRHANLLNQFGAWQRRRLADHRHGTGRPLAAGPPSRGRSPGDSPGFRGPSCWNTCSRRPRGSIS